MGCLCSLGEGGRGEVIDEKHEKFIQKERTCRRNESFKVGQNANIDNDSFNVIVMRTREAQEQSERKSASPEVTGWRARASGRGSVGCVLACGRFLQAGRQVRGSERRIRRKNGEGKG